mmetsp:Transcript_43735/g.127292  ORF Transcript_43735/g.127292 Transcript_43735/m.127292 type:complete len:236 (-) Transcript_43735:242-949(-)
MLATTTRFKSAPPNGPAARKSTTEAVANEMTSIGSAQGHPLASSVGTTLLLQIGQDLSNDVCNQESMQGAQKVWLHGNSRALTKSLVPQQMPQSHGRFSGSSSPCPSVVAALRSGCASMRAAAPAARRARLGGKALQNEAVASTATGPSPSWPRRSSLDTADARAVNAGWGAQPRQVFVEGHDQTARSAVGPTPAPAAGPMIKAPGGGPTEASRHANGLTSSSCERGASSTRPPG